MVATGVATAARASATERLAAPYLAVHVDAERGGEEDPAADVEFATAGQQQRRSDVPLHDARRLVRPAIHLGQCVRHALADRDVVALCTLRVLDDPAAAHAVCGELFAQRCVLRAHGLSLVQLNCGEAVFR